MPDDSASWDPCLEYAALSDVGLRRVNNQDSFLTLVNRNHKVWQDRGHLFIVADGMGGHAGGELASKMAVDTISHTYHKLNHESPASAIHKAIVQTNHSIHLRGQGNPDFKGMGTTSSCLLLLPQGALIAHVGDSRVYRLRGNRLEQLTFDHSLVWEMAESVEPGQSVPAYVPKNFITRSLGPNPEVQVDLEGPFPLAEGDAFLLCSDGLSGQVQDEEIGMILGSLPPQDAVKSLIDLANLRGGPDNTTIVIVRVGGPQAASSGADEVDSSGAMTSASWRTLLWCAAGISAAATVGLAFIEHFLAAGLAGIAAIGLGAVGMRWRPGKEDASSLNAGGKLGRGPYRSYVCSPNAEFVDKLAVVYQELLNAAQGANWAIDWSQVHTAAHQAQTAAGSGNFQIAVREYCHAISWMMAELRVQQKRKKGASRGS